MKFYNKYKFTNYEKKKWKYYQRCLLKDLYIEMEKISQVRWWKLPMKELFEFLRHRKIIKGYLSKMNRYETRYYMNLRRGYSGYRN